MFDKENNKVTSLQERIKKSQPAFGIKKARKLQIKICDMVVQNKILGSVTTNG